MKNIKCFNEWIGESERMESIEGGLASGKTNKDIAAKHGVPVKEIDAQIKKGQEVEMEHTTNPRIAKEIAMDHLMEDPLYYDKLARMEGEQK